MFGNLKFLPLLLMLLVANVARAELKSLTVMVVLDGLRHDYLDPINESESDNDEDDNDGTNGNGFSLPNLRKMGKSGAILSELTPVFPSSRMPNLASLATGVYAENHGVLDGKEVYDKDQDKVMSVKEYDFWAQMKEVGTIWVRFQDCFALGTSLQCCYRFRTYMPVPTTAKGTPKSLAVRSSAAS